jgi:2-aminoethylphosphonate dioxygenase
MNGNVLLSTQQRHGFEERGFLLVPRMFDRQAMAEIERWTREVAAMPEVPGKQMAYYEDSLIEAGKRVLSRIENFSPHHDNFKRLLCEGAVTACVSQLFGEPSVLFKEKINFKMPGGDGFKAHQDVQAGWDRYASLHITMLLSIDEATPENGCLEIAPGHHRHGLIGEMWKPLDEGSNPEIRYELCPTSPGDAIFFDSFIPHRSGPNLTSSPRRVLYITYNRVCEGDHRQQYYADKRASYPPDCERVPGKQYVFRV